MPEQKAGRNVWTKEERAAMREVAPERKAIASREEGERALLEKIAEMPGHDRAMAERIHAIVSAAAPDLMPRTWYGMPAYADQDGKVVCFFKAASKYNERYSTFGLEAGANVAQGSMWPVAWNVQQLTAADEEFISALIKRAVSQPR